MSLWSEGLGNGGSRCGKGPGRRNSEWVKLMMKAWGMQSCGICSGDLHSCFWRRKPLTDSKPNSEWSHRFGSPFKKAAGGNGSVFASAQCSLGAVPEKLQDN